LSTKGYKGAEGEYNFDELGDGLARIQPRAQREGDHHFRQAHRIHGLTGELSVTPFSAADNQGGEMNFGDRRLCVDSCPCSVGHKDPRTVSLIRPRSPCGRAKRPQCAFSTTRAAKLFGQQKPDRR
jgi:hypothetical protein